ncbi:transposase [Streptomyces sp. NPDC050674]|uniref:transposase n=1 Tax=Streptomyces sp. NPDC050674 TaxID=3157216 RepID=UPI00342F39E3
MIDSQSVKADAVVGADSRGFDGGKLINGRKTHAVVDTLGLLLGVMVTAADISDRAAGQVLLARVRGRAPPPDAGLGRRRLDRQPRRVCPHRPALVLAIVKRSDDTRGFVVLPKRWIVERFFAHLMRSRRLARDFERSTGSAEAMVYWSMTLLMTRRLARPRLSRA